MEETKIEIKSEFSHVIDWDKAKTPKDIRNILMGMNIKINPNDAGETLKPYLIPEG